MIRYVDVNAAPGLRCCPGKQVIYLGEEHRITVPSGQRGDVTVTLQVPEAIPAPRFTHVDFPVDMVIIMGIDPGAVLFWRPGVLLWGFQWGFMSQGRDGIGDGMISDVLFYIRLLEMDMDVDDEDGEDHGFAPRVPYIPHDSQRMKGYQVWHFRLPVFRQGARKIWETDPFLQLNGFVNNSRPGEACCHT